LGNPEHRSIGEFVLESGQDVVQNFSEDDTGIRDATFFDEVGMICVPVRNGQRTFGVLDVRATSTVAFSQHDLAVVRLFANSIAANLSAIEQNISFSKGFLDLAHQVENPLTVALRRVSDLVEHGLPTDSKYELQRTRGLIRKAYSIARNAEQFGLLASGQSPAIHDIRMRSFEQIDRALREYVDDYRFTSRPAKNLIYRYESNELRGAMGEGRASVSMAVLDQALACLLDNAEKYSRSDSLISIRCRRLNAALSISVVSEGLRVEEGEEDLLVQREYRGKSASKATESGYGLGLWIVDRLMAAHNGAQFVVSPTDSRGLTRFELRFEMWGMT
jgi:signal transduction histidine kinase